MHNQLDCARELLGAGADASTSFLQDGGLRAAVSANNCAFVTLFIRSHCDLEGVDEHGFTALMYAAQSGYHDIARELVLAGAALNGLCGGARPGRTPLLIALDARQIELATMLIDAQADVHVTWPGDAWTPLHFAALVKDEALVETLINAGAHPHAVTVSGATPMMLLTEAQPEILADWTRHFEGVAGGVEEEVDELLE